MQSKISATTAGANQGFSEEDRQYLKDINKNVNELKKELKTLNEELEINKQELKKLKLENCQLKEMCGSIQ